MRHQFLGKSDLGISGYVEKEVWAIQELLLAVFYIYWFSIRFSSADLVRTV